MWPGTAVHLALLPGYQSNHHSKVLWWYGLGDHETMFCGLWGWNTGEYDCASYPASSFTDLNLQAPASVRNQIFCSGMSRLGSGELFLPGGTQPGTENGMRHAWMFDPVTNAWSERDSMTDFRWYPTSTTLASGSQTLVTSGSRFGSKLHFFGGRIDDVATPADNAIFRYGLWGNGIEPDAVHPPGAEPAARLGHSARFSFSTVWAVEMFGGKDADGDALNDAWLLRVTSQNEGGNDVTYGWQQLAPLGLLPSERYSHAAIPVDTTTTIVVAGATCRSTGMYVVGGIHKTPLGAESVLSDVWRLGYYTPGPNQWEWRWTSLAALPSPETLGPRCGHSLVFDHVSRRLLLFGGRSSLTGGPVDVWAFQLSATANEGTWSKLNVTGTRPAGRFDHAMGYDGYGVSRKFFIFGGELGSETKANDFWEFDLDALAWTLHPNAPGTPPTPRSDATMVVQHGYKRAFVFGGTSATGSEDDVMYTMTYGSHGNHQHGWSAGTLMGFSLNGHAAWDGSISPPFNRVPEIFEKKPDFPPSNDWERYPLAPRWQEWYPQGFVKPDGDVFFAGPGDVPLVFRLATHDWQVLSSAPSGFRGGSAVMYRPGKVMKCGTRDTEVGASAVGTTKWIDVTPPSPTWTASANLMTPRVNHNLVLLPNGQVLATGGTSVARNDVAIGPVYRPEIWDPEWPVGQGHWYGKDTLAADNVIRDYHSTAILLPDARILGAGGNVDGENGDPYPDEKYKANVYCPPYLFNGNALAGRPVINGAPQRIRYGKRFYIWMESGSYGRRPCLIRAASVTHGFDADQRYVPLTVVDSTSVGGTRLLVEAPADSFLAPPGDYLMFVLNPSGVPAVARWVRLGSEWSMGDVSPPEVVQALTAEVIGANSVTLGWNAPGDDGYVGHAWQYEVRYSATALTQDNAGSALLATPDVVPARSGIVQSSQVTGLSHHTNYWFAVRTADESNNLSLWSIIGPVQTLSGGGCTTCEARAGDMRDRDEGNSAPQGNRATRGTPIADGAVPSESERLLVAEFAGDHTNPAWRILRISRQEIDGLVSTDQHGALIQTPDPEAGWWTRHRVAGAGAIGLRRLVGSGRIVFLGSRAIESVRQTPNGYELAAASNSRTGDVAAELGDNPGTALDVAEGDTLSLAYSTNVDPQIPACEESFFIVRAGEEAGALHGRQVQEAAPSLSFALGQNEPNPFEKTTRLSFVIPHASHVRLEIFDMLGRRVRSLADRAFEAGDHELVWDRRTSNGSMASPGVYYYRLEAGDLRARKRMILLP